jgi:hypothetical protein
MVVVSVRIELDIVVLRNTRVLNFVSFYVQGAQAVES